MSHGETNTNSFRVPKRPYQYHSDQRAQSLFASLHQRVTDDKSRDALDFACKGVHFDFIKYLVTECGFDPSRNTASTFTYLLWACFSRRQQTKDVVAFLLDHGADIHARSGLRAWCLTPLLAAAKYSNLQTVRLLLDRGSKLNERATYGWMTLHSLAGATM